MEKADYRKLANWQTKEADGTFLCGLCPRGCQLKVGQRGFCFARKCFADGLYLTTYGLASSLNPDPIEKKPLYHFLPGTTILSLGSIGCNLGCKFCQNWQISKAKEEDMGLYPVPAEKIALAAKNAKIPSVAFTYNDPVIFAEYAIDAALECRRLGIKTVAVTAGYINEKPREEFFAAFDGANIDLKGFTEGFYRDYCQASLRPVLDTLEYVAKSSKTWLEITTLIIPGLNDSPQELDEMTKWIAAKLGTEVPLHFSAFHPSFKLQNIPRTSLESLLKAKQIAEGNGLKFVYLGNVAHEEGSNTYCPHCRKLLIERQVYQLAKNLLKGGHCPYCQGGIPGVF